jgi:hypothetical protein
LGFNILRAKYSIQTGYGRFGQTSGTSILDLGYDVDFCAGELKNNSNARVVDFGDDSQNGLGLPPGFMMRIVSDRICRLVGACLRHALIVGGRSRR